MTLDPVTPSSLVFNAGPGFTPAPQTVNITAGGANTTWAATSNVSWMTVASSNSLTPGSLTISVNPSGMAPGSYPGSVTVSAPGATNSPLIIPVTLAINSTVLSVAPSNLTFFGAVGLNPNPQTIQISNTGTGTLNWTASRHEQLAWLERHIGSNTGCRSLSRLTRRPLELEHSTMRSPSPQTASPIVRLQCPFQCRSVRFSSAITSAREQGIGRSRRWDLPLGGRL